MGGWVGVERGGVAGQGGVEGGPSLASVVVVQ